MDSPNNAKGLEKLLGPVDRPVFAVTGSVVLIVVVWAIISQATLLESLTLAQKWLTTQLGWFYVLATTIFLMVSAYLAFSRHGDLILGRPGDRPEFNYFTWVSMLISCGVGVGYAFWPVAESMYHYYNTPYLAESGTPEAKTVAISISILHWGFHTWNVYALAGLAIAVPAFRLNKPMNISISLHGIFGDKIIGSPLGRFVEFLGSFTTMLGVSTGLGLGLIVLNGGLSFIFGWQLSPLHLSLMLLALIITYMVAAMSGLGKGIRFLAESNSYVALAWGLFILLAGPTVYMLSGMVQSIGTYLDNFIFMSFWTDFDGQKPGWLGSWSVFYWLWWISWAPFCGGFFARISRGRTIRQFLTGVVVVPTVASAVWFGLLGSGSQYVEFNGLANLWATIQADPGQGIYVVADAFGGGVVVNLVIFFSMFIFLATTADSASFFVAMQMSRGVLQPKPLMIMICGGFMGVLAVTLLLTGGLSALQVAGVVAGATFILVMIAMIFSLFRTLRQGEAAASEPAAPAPLKT